MHSRSSPGHTHPVTDHLATISQDAVGLIIPAAAESVGLARSLAAAIAARADLPIDELEDLRLAVSEAVTGAVTDAVAGSQVTCTFVEEAGWLQVQVSYRSEAGRRPDSEGFGWAIMRALATELSAEVEDEVVTLTLRIERTRSAQA